MNEASRFEINAIAVHTAEHLAGPARALMGLHELLSEQEGAVMPAFGADFERIGHAVGQLNTLIDRLMHAKPDEATDVPEASAARIRHDLRTPLNAVIGYLELILEEADGQAGELEAMLAAANELLSHVDAIADLARPVERDGRTIHEALGLDAAQLQAAIADSPHHSAEATILVVDDIMANRELLARRLQRDGHEVVTVGNGTAALQAAAARAFDLVLLDILMPDMNGIEVLSRLKSEERSRRIPVIVISGLDDVEAVIHCIEAGADDYLMKPFNPVLLRARISAIMERKQWLDQEKRYLACIEAEKQRADALLQAVLPGQIVARLQAGEQVIADRFAEVTVLFADIVGFSPIAARLPAALLVERLGALFGAFDVLVERHGVEKIKTIGDAYMAASGIPEPAADHADRMLSLASAMLERLDPRGAEDAFRIRIGVHTGPVVAGLIGRHRFVYDVWGETVNVASRLESQGVAGRIHLSDATRRALTVPRSLEPRGPIDLRGIGRMTTFLLKQ